MELPVQLASRQRRSISDAAMSGIGSSRGAHISIRGGRFHLVNAAGMETHIDTHYLDIVVVDANVNTSKVFFAYDYDPSVDAPPDCFSDNGTGPSLQSMTPQSPTCSICPWNARGSDTTFTGKPTKACQDRKKLAVVIPDDPAVTVYEFQIPPGSVTNLKAYNNWISQQPTNNPGRKLDLADLVTRVEFDPDKQFTMKFTAVALADDDRTMQVIDYIDANKLADVAVGRNDVAWDPEAVKARATIPQQAAPAAIQQQAPLPPPPQPTAFALPPQQAPAALAPSPGAPAPGGRRPRGRPPQQPQQQATAPATAPFMAPAQQQAPLPPPAPAAPLAIPAFLQRTPENQPPTDPGARAGIAAPPPPPAGIQAALSAAVGLASRRG